MESDSPVEHLFYEVNDPDAPLENCPALTTFMYKICNNNVEKFDESCRLIRLFMDAAYNLGKQDALQTTNQNTPQQNAGSESKDSTG